MAISILSIINVLSPKDGGSRKVARDVPYGAAARQKLDIYAPRDAVGPLPVVFFVYGGSWSDGDRRNYDFVGRALAAQGFVTVIADYRLLPEVEYPEFLEDCAEAFGWVAEHIGQYGGDAQRMALMGHSAGAYNAAMLALDPAYLAERNLLGRVRCLVGLSGPYDFFPFDGPITLRTFGAVHEPTTTQPINHVTAKASPMFLATGDKDTLVYPRNTVALAARLRAAGVDVLERHYETLGHPGTLLALGRPARGIAPVLADVADYLQSQLG
ncbi:alpha/beta hydrolase [Devosia sp. SL43]|uniref:alpha/beta hydrolase n=1 Tax=Devosia sp. SL43 TaxID=2806348 RepID=UPI001F3C7708|nr:alpha/beta hydrolase [Devosia sp. SL43]UJW83909.1 alpha/beta hydrolase [Devosia sp. SL43]